MFFVIYKWFESVFEKIKNRVLTFELVKLLENMGIEVSGMRYVPLINYFQKCLFANAYPEPVLRYCSNSNAASFEVNAI